MQGRLPARVIRPDAPGDSRRAGQGGNLGPRGSSTRKPRPEPARDHAHHAGPAPGPRSSASPSWGGRAGAGLARGRQVHPRRPRTEVLSHCLQTLGTDAVRASRGRSQSSGGRGMRRGRTREALGPVVQYPASELQPGGALPSQSRPSPSLTSVPKFITDGGSSPLVGGSFQRPELTCLLSSVPSPFPGIPDSHMEHDIWGSDFLNSSTFPRWSPSETGMRAGRCVRHSAARAVIAFERGVRVYVHLPQGLSGGAAAWVRA